MDSSPPTSPLITEKAARCPMRSAATNTARCPIREDPSTINPLNNMPDLPQSPAPNQLRALPTDRVTSSIPRPPDATYGAQKPSPDKTESKWEYPSPQQFYNALMRKGWNTPEEHVETMVLIHNRLNEDAWAEILRWEARFGGGASNAANLELVEFAGIHTHLTHKARIYQYLRRYFPSYFAFEAPFDRHDWIVRRPHTGKKLRYVIDYYSSRKSMYAEPEFHLDVRPASDSIGNVVMKVQYLIEGGEAKQTSTKMPFSSMYPYLIYITLPLLVVLAIGTQIKI